MDKRALSQRTIALIVFVFFLASFLQASDERHFRSASGESAGQDLSNSWNQPRSARLTLLPAYRPESEQQTVRLYAGQIAGRHR